MPVINVKMVEGRTLEKKQELAEALTRDRICHIIWIPKAGFQYSSAILRRKEITGKLAG